MDFIDAEQLLYEHALKLPIIKKRPALALGMSIAEDIFSPLDLPPFANSSVDGFALKISSSLKRSLIGEIRAVSQARSHLKENETMRIMTGAPIPEGADAVIMKEEAFLVNGELSLMRVPHKNENIRFQGEDIKKSALALKKGSLISPQALGLMLALGLDEVEVFSKPQVRIIVTGDELVDPPRPLNFGEVYHLMGPMLLALCQTWGVSDLSYEMVGDDENAIEHAIKKSLDKDIILLSGGISKGEYDLVKPVLNRLGVREIFHGGTWRPGKPLFFGRKDGCRIFGLPGNPVSAFTCFHLFVKVLLERSFGREYLPKSAILLSDFKKKSGMTHFLQAVVKDGLSILENQGSHQIFSLNQANALMLAPKECAIVKAGESVKYYPI